MKVHIVRGFPDRIDGNWLAKLHEAHATDKAGAEAAADYYTRFYGGLREFEVISFKVQPT